MQTYFTSAKALIGLDLQTIIVTITFYLFILMNWLSTKSCSWDNKRTLPSILSFILKMRTITLGYRTSYRTVCQFIFFLIFIIVLSINIYIIYVIFLAYSVVWKICTASPRAVERAMNWRYDGLTEYCVLIGLHFILPGCSHLTVWSRSQGRDEASPKESFKYQKPQSLTELIGILDSCHHCVEKCTWEGGQRVKNFIW